MRGHSPSPPGRRRRPVAYNVVVAARKKVMVSRQGSNELSRLLARERLARAGVPDAMPAAEKADPDLKALFERVRSTKIKTVDNAPAIPREAVKKLAGG